YMGQYHGWRSSFYIFGILGCVLGLVLIFLLRETRRGETETSEHAPLNWHEAGVLDGLRKLLGNRAVMILISVFVGANFVAVIFLTWMPSYLTRKFNMSLSMAGLSAT